MLGWVHGPLEEAAELGNPDALYKLACQLRFEQPGQWMHQTKDGAKLQGMPNMAAHRTPMASRTTHVTNNKPHSLAITARPFTMVARILTTPPTLLATPNHLTSTRKMRRMVMIRREAKGMVLCEETGGKGLSIIKESASGNNSLPPPSLEGSYEGGIELARMTQY